MNYSFSRIALHGCWVIRSKKNKKDGFIWSISVRINMRIAGILFQLCGSALYFSIPWLLIAVLKKFISSIIHPITPFLSLRFCPPTLLFMREYPSTWLSVPIYLHPVWVEINTSTVHTYAWLHVPGPFQYPSLTCPFLYFYSIKPSYLLGLLHVWGGCFFHYWLEMKWRLIHNQCHEDRVEDRLGFIFLWWR